MWLCTNNGFLSIVTNPAGKELLLVRARRKGDIESIFPDAGVERTPGKDYLYRASISRADVAAAMAKSLTEIDYPNFKNSVKDAELHRAYAQVWRTMATVQAVPPYGSDSVAARAREGVSSRAKRPRPN